MNKHLQQKVEQLGSQRKKTKRWQRVVAGMAAVVLLATNGALLLQAETTEDTTYCGLQEHTHTEGCYALAAEPVCQQEEAPAHTHELACYSAMLCGQEQTNGHAHTDVCFKQTVVCGQEESEAHTHEEACYTAERICGLEEYAAHTHTLECCDPAALSCGSQQTEGHSHTESCYGEETVCQLEVHTHGLACFSNPAADLETAADWEKTFIGITLSGNWNQDLAAVAKSQLGYRESTVNYEVADDGVTTRGYTRYGDWMGDAYLDWSAAFVAFCLHYAEVEGIPAYSGGTVSQWRQELEIAGMTHNGAPQTGDVVFLDDDGNGITDHAGIVTESGGTLNIVVGDDHDGVRQRTDPAIVAVLALPQNPNAPTEETTEPTGETTAPTGETTEPTEETTEPTGETTAPTEETTEPTEETTEPTEETTEPTGETTAPTEETTEPTGETTAPTEETTEPTGETTAPTEETTDPTEETTDILGELITFAETQADAPAFLETAGTEATPLTGECGANVTYKLENGVLTISGTGAMTDYGDPKGGGTPPPWYDHAAEITSLVIETDVTSIGKRTCLDCVNLKNVSIADTVTLINNSAFSGCTGLENIVIPDTVTNLGSFVFNGCTSLTNVQLPANITQILNDTFHGCTSLTSIDLPEGLTRIGNAAFSGCAALTSIVIPESVTFIDIYAFQLCSSLASVTLCKNLTEIKQGVFANCTSLTTIEIPDSVTYIVGHAFLGCSNLTSINFPTEMVKIGVGAFNGCTKLSEITLQSKACTTILDQAFYSATNVKKITVCDTVDVLSGELLNTFTDLVLVFEPNNYFKLDADFTKGPANTACATLAAGDYYVDANGVLYALDSETSTATLVYCPNGVASYTVPAAITSEDDNTQYTVNKVEALAFEEAEALTEITFPENAQITVESYAFSGSGLKSVNGLSNLDDILNLPGMTFEFQAFYQTAIAENRGDIRSDSIVLSAENAYEVEIQTDIENKSMSADAFEFYTGQAPVTSVELKAAGSAYKDYVVRVYVSFDPENSYGEQNQSLGVRKLDDIVQLNVFKTDRHNTYCLEFQLLEEGSTAKVSFTTTYRNGYSTSGQARIYAVILTEEQGDALGNAAPLPAEYQLLTWTSCIDEFKLTTTPSEFKLQGVYEDGKTRIITKNGSYFDFTLTPDENALMDMGDDNVKTVDFHTVTTLPEELTWRDGLIEAINNSDNVKVVTDGNVAVIQVNIDGTWEEFVRLDKAATDPKTVKVSTITGENDKPQVVIDWTYTNTRNLEREISSLNYKPTFSAENSFEVAEGYGELEHRETIEMTMDVAAEVSYTHSEETRELNVTCTSSLKAAEFGIETELVVPEEIDKLYAGEAYPISLQIRNLSAATTYLKGANPVVKLPQHFYMSGADLEKAFSSDQSEHLTLTISEANFCTPASRTVTVQDGGTATIHNAHVSAENPYYVSGTSTECASNYTGAITITKTGGSVQMVCGDKIEITTPDEIQAVLDSWGFTVGADTLYELQWNFDTLKLGASQILDLPVPTHAKDSFMRTRKDAQWYIAGQTDDYGEYLLNDESNAEYGSEYYWVDENGNYLDKNGAITEKLSAAYKLDHDKTTALEPIWRDFTLRIDTYVRTDDGYQTVDTLKSGDIARLRIFMTNLGDVQYDALPMVAYLQGDQEVLVPVENNGALIDDARGSMEVNGKTYYILGKEGEYHDVYIGGVLADTVKVSDQGTLIYWYLTGNVSSLTPEIFSWVDGDGTEADSGDLYVNNSVFLNDHQTRRLCDRGAFYGGSWASPEKSIVTERGETPDADVVTELYHVAKGESVTYRLSFIGHGTGAVKVVGQNMWDVLPLTVQDAAWSTANISVEYAKEATVTNPDSWYITEWNELENQRLCWENDFSITFTGETHVYVTLTFPDKKQDTDQEVDLWEKFIELYDGVTRIENIFHLNSFEDTAYLDLGLRVEAVIQKGVLHSGGSIDDTYIRENDYNGGDRLQYYINRGTTDAYVYYYASIYNDGQSRMYIQSIQDVLPRGFSFAGFYTPSEKTNIDPTVSDPDTDRLIKHYDISSMLTATSNENITTAGNTRVTFEINGAAGLPFIYDSMLKMYYIEPGTHIFFIYGCEVGNRDETDERATNLLGVSVYDYAGQGVVKGDSKLAGPVRTGTTPNESTECVSMDGPEATSYGFDPVGNDAEAWMMAEVTVSHDPIQPDLTKVVSLVEDINGNDKLDTGTATNTDVVTWKITTTNDSFQTILGYTLTDVMDYPYTFTGAVQYTAYNVNNVVSFNARLFTILNRETVEGQEVVTLQEGGQRNTQVKLTVGGDPVKVRIDSKNMYVLVSISKEPADSARPDEVLSVTFPATYTAEDGTVYRCVTIPRYGRSELQVKTQNVSSEHRNTVYYNNCYLTPEQNFEPELATNAWEATRVVDGVERTSLQNRSSITVNYGSATSSYKRVTEVGNEENTALSSDATNYIRIESKDSVFRYSLSVKGSESEEQDKLVIIDNLPYVGDYSVLSASEPRNSEFKVVLADEPDFEVTVTTGGVVKTLGKSQYSIAYSTESGPFTDADWAGTTDWSSEQAEARSIRLVIENDADYSIMPAGSTVTLSFNARADANASMSQLYGKTAWNGFGYYYEVGDNSSQSAPMYVGVRFSSVPTLKKQLQDTNGNAIAAETEETYRFLIYAGEAEDLSGENEAQIAQALKDIDYSVAQITVPEGESSQNIVLNELKLYSYNNGWVATDDDWLWTTGSKYTVMELPNGDDCLYEFESIGGNTDNSYTFTYSGSGTQLITGVNQRRTWRIELTKVNDHDEPLKGAWFGLYSPDSSDALSKEEVEKFGLEPAPALTYEKDGKTYYLMSALESNANGLVIWSSLTQLQYLVRELRAPAGYNIDNTARVVTWQNGETAYQDAVSLEVENASGYKLPETGGAGVNALYALGASLSAASGLFLIKRRKRRK